MAGDLSCYIRYEARQSRPALVLSSNRFPDKGKLVQVSVPPGRLHCPTLPAQVKEKSLKVALEKKCCKTLLLAPILMLLNTAVQSTTNQSLDLDLNIALFLSSLIIILHPPSPQI